MKILHNPSFSNTAAVVVAYFPDQAFASRLCSHLSHFARVYLIDNTPAASAQVEFRREETLEYHHQSSNMGLAEALNKGCSAALKDGFQWISTLDQDTELEEDYLDKAWGLEPESRLSCQAVVGAEPLVVEIPRYTINHASEKH